MFKECNECLCTLHIDCFYVYSKGYLGRRSICKKCKYIKDVARSRTVKGLVHRIYGNQVKSSKRRGHQNPTYTKSELYVWVKNNKEFTKLYSNWVESKYDVNFIPSVDRIDDLIGYNINNIQLTTWEINNAKGRTSPKRRLQLDI